MQITITISVEDRTDIKRTREITVRDGGSYGMPLPPKRMRSKALSETKSALAVLAPDE